MARVRFSMHASLDGYIEDATGSIGFSTPTEEVHRMANERTREASAFLFGRRLFEMMEEYWTAAAAEPEGLSDVAAEFAREYVNTPRYVFSDTLDQVPDGVRLVRRRDTVDVVTRLKQEADGYLDIGGPALAASLGDLVDEFRLFLLPVVLGGGKPFFAGEREFPLRLIEERALESGVVYLRYERVLS